MWSGPGHGRGWNQLRGNRGKYGRPLLSDSEIEWMVNLANTTSATPTDVKVLEMHLRGSSLREIGQTAFRSKTLSVERIRQKLNRAKRKTFYVMRNPFYGI